jgi:hypothetical protein
VTDKYTTFLIVGSNGYVQSNPTTEKASISPFQSKRNPKAVSIQASPVEFDNAMRVQLCIQGTWVTIPIFGALRICTGPNIPKWSPEQEVNTGVSAIKVTMNTKEVFEISTYPEYPIMIAPVE